MQYFNFLPYITDVFMNEVKNVVDNRAQVKRYGGELRSIEVIGELETLVNDNPVILIGPSSIENIGITSSGDSTDERVFVTVAIADKNRIDDEEKIVSSFDIWQLYFIVRAVIFRINQKKILTLVLPLDRTGQTYDKVVTLVPQPRFVRVVHNDNVEAWEMTFSFDIAVNLKLLLT